VRALEKLKRKLKHAAFLPFDRSDRIPELQGRTVENDDAWSQGVSGGDQFPPNYVRPVDEGRPRH
jgi:hypothetical protein